MVGGNRRIGARAALIAVPVALLALIVPSHATTSPGVTFTKPVVAIPYPGTTTGPLPALATSEPQMLIAHDGLVLVTAQFQDWDCTTGKPLKNNGVTYEVQGTNPQRLCIWAARPGQRFRLIGGDCCQNGDDASLGQTPQSGTILETFMSNVGAGTGVPGASMSRSTDNGAHWSDSVDIDTQLAQDRPFLLVASEHNVLLSFTAPPGNIFVVRSTNAGKTWGLPQIVTPVPPEAVLSLNGEPTYDVARHEIVLSYAHSPDRLASNLPTASPGTLSVIEVARSHDDGKTWHMETAATLAPGHGVLSLPSMTSDTHGREYLAYDAPVGAHGVGAFLVESRRDGSWSKPIRVDPASGSAMEPSVRATGDGHVDVADYHSTASDAFDHVRRWTVSVAVSYDAARHFAYGDASRHVVYVGTEQDAQATIYDLLAFALDRHGAANVAWTSDGSTYPTNTNTRIEYSREVRSTD